ncbi:MAG: hypothetical protein ACKV2T_14245 [Kofleriaceae bacterium]
MNDAVPILESSVVPPRRLRRSVVAGALLASAAFGGVVLRVAEHLQERAFVDAEERRAKINAAREIARRYAIEGFPAWVVTHPDGPCPPQLAELNVFVDRIDTSDPWGLPFQSYCHSGNTFLVVSAGPDRTHGTYDDILEGNR